MLYRQEFALAGYEFCISTLEGKIEKEKELADAVLSGRETCFLDRCLFATGLHCYAVIKGKVSELGRESYPFWKLKNHF